MFIVFNSSERVESITKIGQKSLSENVLSKRNKAIDAMSRRKYFRLIDILTQDYSC